MRLLILCFVSSTAFADPIDLDAVDGPARLAEAAGACAKTEPAFIQQACRGKPLPAKDFVKRYRAVSATAAATSLVRLTLPVEDHGKGYLFSITEPAIHCDAKRCMYEPSAVVFVSTDVDAAKIADVGFAFRVDKMWRVRQWWAPRPTAIKVTLFDSRGNRLGEGSTLAKTPSK